MPCEQFISTSLRANQSITAPLVIRGQPTARDSSQFRCICLRRSASGSTVAIRHSAHCSSEGRIEAGKKPCSILTHSIQRVIITCLKSSANNRRPFSDTKYSTISFPLISGHSASSFGSLSLYNLLSDLSLISDSASLAAVFLFFLILITKKIKGTPKTNPRKLIATVLSCVATPDFGLKASLMGASVPKKKITAKIIRHPNFMSLPASSASSIFSSNDRKVFLQCLTSLKCRSAAVEAPRNPRNLYRSKMLIKVNVDRFSRS